MPAQLIVQALTAALSEVGIDATYTHHQDRKVLRIDTSDGEPIIISDPDRPHLDSPVTDYRSVQADRGECNLYGALFYIPVWIPALQDMQALARTLAEELSLPA